jgi:hypothetical protein
MDRPTAIAIPGSTPSSATPAKATSASVNSTRRCFHSRVIPGRSASESDAVMTTAARAGWGRFRNSPGRATMRTTISTAPTTPVSCVRAPARSATAVREALVLTGKPWNNPAARLAVPMPIISWLPRTSWPLRSAKAVEVDMVSASETTAMARAPPASGRTSDQGTVGIVSGGKPAAVSR